MNKIDGIDKTGIALYLIICIFAIFNISSVDEALGKKQALFFIISLVVSGGIFLMRANFFENLSGIIYIIGVLLLVGLFPFGTEILGQKNWYKFGSITLQPVEFAKIGTALMLANYAAHPDFNIKEKRSFFTAFIIIGIPGLVVLMIPDVGSLLVFMAYVMALYREGLSGWFFGVIGIVATVFLSSLYFEINLNLSPIYPAGFTLVFLLIILFFNHRKIKWLPLTSIGLALAVLGLVAMSFFAQTILSKFPKHQKERIEVLYKGEKAFRDTSGYNLLYSKTAIGSGGLVGKGYKEGSVTKGKFVPEQETDYIFCTVGEEWGFWGSSILILIYALYIGRIYYLSERQKTTFNRVFGYSFASILFIHFSINIGMVMGLFPTVGIPLPYFSYGGSSLLAFSIMTAIFFKLNYEDHNSLV